MPSPVNPHNYR